jgi:hypothetical protein
MSQKISEFTEATSATHIKNSFVAAVLAETTDSYKNIKIKLNNFYTAAEVDALINGLSLSAPELKLNEGNKILISDQNGKISTSEVASTVLPSFNTHINDVIGTQASYQYHIKDSERTSWTGHVNSGALHVTSDDKTNWNNNITKTNGHVSNNTIHVTQDDKDKWNKSTTSPFLDYTKGQTIKWDTIYNRKLDETINVSWIPLTEGKYTPWENGYAWNKRSGGNDQPSSPFYMTNSRSLTNNKKYTRSCVVIPPLSVDSMYIIDLGEDYSHNDETFVIKYRKNSSSGWKYIGSYTANDGTRLQLPMPANSQISLSLIITDSAWAKIIAFPYTSN